MNEKPHDGSGSGESTPAGKRTDQTLTPGQWRLVDELFDAALAVPEAERVALVERECSDERVRAEVLSLLSSSPAASGALRALVGATATSASRVSMLGHRIGPYRLTALLGEGGMGLVYLAEHDDFHREVAIKVLRRGLGSPEEVARFRDERQILAGLDHPGIVRLLDGGAENGVSYLVMEKVTGSPLTVHAKARECSLRDRVMLVRKVCEALAYAHGKLVIHRDIKPSNILVGSDGAPKLLDFGIAKLLDPERALESRTQTGAMLLTPEYASPEQARGELVGVATDVYSLGAVLYELFVDRPPQQPSGGPLEILRAICDVEPPRPSSLVARERARELAGDLDNIVLKALRKDVTQRYASVQELGEDLRRYLDGEPVHARTPTVGYRAGKFVRRHWGKLAIATVVALALGVATAISLVQAGNADRARVVATTERLAAEAQTRHARDLLLVSLAARANDPTMEVVLLREVSDPARTPGWTQATINALMNPIARGVFYCDDRSKDFTAFVSFSVDGKQVLIQCRGGTAYVLPTADMESGERSRMVALPHSTSEDPVDMSPPVFTSDGRVVTIANRPTYDAKVWTLARPEAPQHISTEGPFIAVDATGTYLVEYGTDKTVLRELAGTGARTLPAGPVRSASFSADGKHLATVSTDNAARIWNVEDDRPPTILRHEIQLGRVGFDRTGHQLVTAARDAVRIWNLDRPAAPIREIKRPESLFAFSPDGTHFAITEHGTGELWDLTSPGDPREFVRGAADFTLPVFHPDGEHIMTWRSDGSVRFWHRGNGSELAFGTYPHLRDVSFDPQGKRMLTTAAVGSVRLYPLDGPASMTLRAEHLPGGRRLAGEIAFSPDGTRIAAPFVGSIVIFGTDGSVHASYATQLDAPWLRRSPDGRSLMGRSTDPSAGKSVVTIWPAEGGRVIRLPEATAADDVILDAAFAVDGHDIVILSRSDSAGMMLRRWTLGDTPKLVSETTLGDSEQTGQLGPFGAVAVVNSKDFSVRVHDSSGKPLTPPLRGHQDYMLARAFSRDGARLVTSANDATIGVWHLDGSVPPVIIKSRGNVASLDLSPDGKYIVGVRPFAPGVRIWRADGSDEPFDLPVACQPDSVTFSPDGKLVAVGCDDGLVELVPFPLLEPDAIVDALWRSTSHCLSADDRRAKLGDDAATAAAGIAACSARSHSGR